MPSRSDMGNNSPARHLARLFEEYDCVILPGIGGFLLHENSSTLRKEEQQAFPPSRLVKFNSLLKDDDGLLTHSIAKTESVPFAEAKKIVDRFVDEGLRIMHDWESWELEGIGSFRLNNEEKLVFSPLKDYNCLVSSYGLKPVTAKRIRRPDKERPQRGKRVDRRPVVSRDKAPGTVRWTLILALPVISFLLWGIIAPESIQRYYTSYSVLFVDLLKPGNSHSHDEAGRKFSPALLPETVSPEILPGEAVSEPSIPVVDNNAINTTEALGKEDMAPINTETIAPEPLSGGLILPFTAPADPKRYYIIGGAFGEVENANRFLKSLQKKGFDPEIAGANGSGHLRISYASFAGKAEALAYLGGIREKENPGAWLLRY